MDIKLSKNFNLSEFLYSSTIDSIKRTMPDLYQTQNFVDFEIVQHIQLLVQFILQPLRDELGFSIKINSGYRCPFLNKRVGGSSTSQHLQGYAADVTCADNSKLLALIRSKFNEMKFDQVIVYGEEFSPRFIHISFAFVPRRQLLFKD